ncbi:hypothetical protein GVAV_000063 [Gurleya vavrai]
MECSISVENAKTIDKILKTFTTSTITIQTSSNSILLQLIQEDQSLIANCTFESEFFTTFNCSKNQINNIQTIYFYKPKMHKLDFILTKFKCILIWKFENYTHRKEIFLADTELYKLNFDIKYYVNLNQMLIFDLLKHFECKNIELKFQKNYLTMNSKDNRIETKCKLNIESEFESEIELPCYNLKRIVALYEISDSFGIGLNDDLESVNFIIEGINFIISIFCAAYS